MDFLIPDYQSDVRSEIWFDDLPVDSLIYISETPAGSTPADIVLTLAHGLFLTDEMMKTLIKILISDINIAIDLNKVKEATTLLESVLEKTSDQPAEKIRLLIALINLNHRHSLFKAMHYCLKIYKLIKDYDELIDEKTRDLGKSVYSYYSKYGIFYDTWN